MSRTFFITYAGYDLECEVISFYNTLGNHIDPPEQELEYDIVSATKVDAPIEPVDVKTLEFTDKQDEEISGILFDLCCSDTYDYDYDDNVI